MRRDVAGTDSEDDVPVLSGSASVYGGGKGAVEQFTAVAARGLGPRGITANTVSRGGSAAGTSTSTAE
ncbi:hypothetical protein SHL15_8236 [Streptomyces hygroscopicus subsp. limoneus]|nr:hypothetical protein SHL15_8236 [Streptomyces hygroscopicus subsp. limoneus]